ncbi:hypothetical protein ACIRP7_28990 [Streptomyces sp. NPDC102270]
MRTGPAECGQAGGRGGLMLVHYVSDPVHMHTGDAGTTVRFHLSL